MIWMMRLPTSARINQALVLKLSVFWCLTCFFTVKGGDPGQPTGASEAKEHGAARREQTTPAVGGGIWKVHSLYFFHLLSPLVFFRAWFCKDNLVLQPLNERAHEDRTGCYWWICKCSHFPILVVCSSLLYFYISHSGLLAVLFS